MKECNFIIKLFKISRPVVQVQGFEVPDFEITLGSGRSLLGNE